MNVHDVCGIELWVGNARQSARYFCDAFGFTEVATDRGRSDRVSHILQQGEIRVTVTGATNRASEVASFVRRHGDGVRDIMLTVDEDAAAVVEGFGDTIHSLSPVSYPWPTHDAIDDAVGLIALDHVAVSLDRGEREGWVERYERELGFARLGTASTRIDIGGSAFTMSSVRARRGRATFVFVEPSDGSSQIADFLDEYGGPGVHHLAFATGDILKTAAALRQRGVGTLPVPAAYYQQARERVGAHDLPWEELEDAGILVDSDDDGLLLQAFTEPIGDRPTLYFEIIQREGASGFGVQNIRALYHAVVLQRSTADARDDVR